MAVRITELFANPAGADRGNEWVEICADEAGGNLSRATLEIGKRSLYLTGALPPGSCSIVRTGTAAIRNREATASLTLPGFRQDVSAPGSAPEGHGFHVAGGTWASSTPGQAAFAAAPVPAIANLSPESPLPAILGTATCTAGILTALATAAFRYARDRHHALSQ